MPRRRGESCASAPGTPGEPMTDRQQFAAYLALAGVVVLLDQLSKQAAYANLLGQPPVEVLPFFRLALVFNRGAAFGFLSDAGGWQHYFLSALAVIVSAALVCWLWRARARQGGALLSLGLALVLAGALGNLIDRVSHQHVIDFILLHWRGWYFPAFNLADSAISIGALILILDSLGWRPGGKGKAYNRRD